MDMTALNRSSIILAAIVNAFIMMFFEKDIHTLAYMLQFDGSPTFMFTDCD